MHLPPGCLPCSACVPRRAGRALAMFVLLFALTLRAVGAQVAVLTQHNDVLRTGANLGETTLNTANVNINQFGKLFTRTLDGHVYAQPLYVPNVLIAGKGKHNVVYVATAHNTVYAFDADDPRQSSPLWSVNLGPSVPSSLINTPNILNEVGIISTPVILASTTASGNTTGRIYVVPKTLENGVQVYRIHALDIATGKPVSGSPVQVAATVPGTGDGGTTVTFTASQQCNRPGLLLSHGYLYVAFASHEDYTPYHGWVFAYNSSNLKTTPLVFNTTPDGGMGGIWMGGQGLVSDQSGNVYGIVGNGSSDAINPGGTGYGEAFFKLLPTQGKLKVIDWFIPYDYDTLNAYDADLGSGGAMGIPGTRLIVGGGKWGKLYLINTDKMGHYHAGADSQIVQSFQAYNGEYRGGFVFWNSPNNGPQVYVWGGYDYGRAYPFVKGALQTTPASTTGVAVSGGASNSPGMSISANGSQVGTGILWAAMSSNGDSDHATVPGVLRAFDASNLAVELWNSDLYPARDALGNWAKFCPPTIANGKVYVATHSNQLCVYGLTTLNIPPGTGSVIGINFVGGSGNGTPSGLAPTEMAGVVPKPYWNNVGTSTSGQSAFLLDDSGGSSGAAVSWSCDNLWSLPIAETAGNARLMKGYLDTGSGTNPATVSVSHLPASFVKNGYDVYVYCDGDNGGASRTGLYTIGSTTISATDAGVDFSGTFTRAINGNGNYVRFINLTASSFTLTATPGPASDGVARAPVNAIQIVAHTP